MAYCVANLEQAFAKNKKNGKPDASIARSSPVANRKELVQEICSDLGIESRLIHHVGEGMYCGVVHVTPEMAFKWLTEHNAINRGMPCRSISVLASVMRSGQFLLTHEAVAFDTNRRLQDGQHRLAGIVESFTTQRLVVFVATDPGNILVINTGRSRDWKDSAAFNGLTGVTQRTQAVVRRMHYGIDPQKLAMTNAQMQKFYDLNCEAIEWTMAAMKVRNAAPATVEAAIAKAYYHVDLTRLEEFCDVLRTRIVEREENSAPNTLMRWLEACRAKRTNPESSRVCAATIRAIRAFMENEPWNKAVPATSDTYPLPKEKCV